jgi:hypothetical protein
MGGKMKVLIVGLPLFAKRLAENLNRFDPGSTYIHLDTYYSRFDKLKAFWHLRTADCVFSINGTLSTSALFDRAFKKGIPVVMNWVGTDVSAAVKAVRENRHLETYREKAIHFCEVAWIRDELTEAGIHAEIVNFAAFDQQFKPVAFSGDRLQVLSYISGSRPAFYGMDAFLGLARRFPEADFAIAGATGDGYHPLPENVKALGWVDNMNELFERSHVCVRFPEHDGLSTFVLEALARGKQVLYKYPFEQCIYCPDEETLAKGMEAVAHLFKQQQLPVNEEGMQFIRDEFNETVILGGLVSRLKKLRK